MGGLFPQWELDVRDAWAAFEAEGVDAASKVRVRSCNALAESISAEECALCWRTVLVASLVDSRIHAEQRLQGEDGFLVGQLEAADRLVVAWVGGAQISSQLTKERMVTVRQLAGGVAHELNNILMVVGTYADFLVEAVGHEKQLREDLTMITDGVSRATGLVGKLMAFTQRQGLNPAPLDLNALVDDFSRSLEVPEGVTIERSLAATARVLVDEEQLRRVLADVCENAVEAIDEAGSVTFETEDARAEVVLRIRDSGRGFDDEVRARAFEPFFSTKPRRGAGLGLSTAHGVITQSGGSIDLRREDETTVVEIRLPQEAGQTSRAVLVVHEDGSVRDELVGMLERLGHRASSASPTDAAKALEGIEVVIVSAVLSTGAGASLIAELQAHAPVGAIVVSAHALPHESVPTLTLPLREDQLATAVARCR